MDGQNSVIFRKNTQKWECDICDFVEGKEQKPPGKGEEGYGLYKYLEEQNQ